MSKLLIHNARFVDAYTDTKKGALLINDGKIEGFLTPKAAKQLLSDVAQGKSDVSLYDAGGLTVMPSFIDMHAHFRDPGLTQKEDLESGCKAAAAGGFGTLVLMPNTSPVVSSLEMAKENNRRGEEIGLASLIQSVSITKDFDGKTLSHLEQLTKEEVPVITEDGHEVTDSAVMLEAMKIAAKKGIVVSCHCEDPFLAAAARPFRKEALELLHKEGSTADDKAKAVELLRKADALLRLAEDTATDRNILLAKEAGCHLHLCHVSTAHCIASAARAKSWGQNISLEITPHHIGLTGDTDDGIVNIVNPPLRSDEDRFVLIESLIEGVADAVATDHAPHTMDDKKSGSPGFSGLETAFAVCYTNLVLDSGMDMSALSNVMSANPAKLLGLEDRGVFKDGTRADIVVVDTEKTWTVRGAEFASKGKFTPLEGQELTGKVVATFRAGTRVF